MPHVTVNGRDLFYLRAGSGPPLLLVMGMSGNHLHWGEPFIDALGRDFETIAYDHRGIGRSDAAPDPFTIAELADDAAGLLDALAVERAHVLGISMGGMVAQQLALRHPGRIATLTLGCTYAGGEGSVITDPDVARRLAEPLLAGDRAAALRAGYEANVSATFAADAANWARFERVATELTAPVAVIMAQLQAVAGHDVSARLGEIRMPTLVVHGSEDVMLPIANAYAIAERIPGARLEVLEGVGHMFWWERPARAAELVRELAASAGAIAQ